MSESRSGPEARAELIAIARQLLDEQHPEDLSLREVARRAGLTSGAPAHHFGNKLGLLAACAEVSWAELADRLEVSHGGTPAQEIREKAQIYLDYALANPGPYRLMMSRMFKDAARFAQIAEWRNRAMRTVVDTIDAATPSADPKFAWRRGFAVWTLLHGYVTLKLDGAVPPAKLEGLSRDMSRMAVLVGLLPDEDD